MELQSQHLMAFSVKAHCLQEVIPDQTNERLQLNISSLKPGKDVTLLFSSSSGQHYLSAEDENKAPLFLFPISEDIDGCQVGTQSFIVTFENLSVVLQFKAKTDLRTFQQLLRNRAVRGLSGEDGEGRRDTSPGKHSAPDTPGHKCYQFHSVLSQQQSLLQDYHKTATYHRAILLNDTDFKDKVVLDVSCDSGMLAFFAVQAGAAKVYSVDPGPMAKFTQALAQSNGLSDKITVLNCEVDGVVYPEAVDIIVSEPMGHMLLSDRLVEKVLSAKKCLKCSGLMFPSWADLHVAPFSDEQLYFEHHARAAFWQQRNFYGVNLSSLHNFAVAEFFRQPIVDTFDVQVLMSRSVKHRINFKEAMAEDLRRLEIPFVFALKQSGLVHGLAFWFDVAFQGSKATVWMSTAPTEPLTRWSQVRCLLQTPLFAKMGQTLSGTVLLISNGRQSYDIHITATIDQSGFTSGNVLDLKNPFFRISSWLTY